MRKLPAQFWINVGIYFFIVFAVGTAVIGLAVKAEAGTKGKSLYHTFEVAKFCGTIEQVLVAADAEANLDTKRYKKIVNVGKGCVDSNWLQQKPSKAINIGLTYGRTKSGYTVEIQPIKFSSNWARVVYTWKIIDLADYDEIGQEIIELQIGYNK